MSASRITSASSPRSAPGRPLSLEIIVTGPRYFNYRDPKFWDAYRSMPAWEFARFMALVEKGTPQPAPPRLSQEAAIVKEREDLEASMTWTQALLAQISDCVYSCRRIY